MWGRMACPVGGEELYHLVAGFHSRATERAETPTRWRPEQSRNADVAMIAGPGKIQNSSEALSSTLYGWYQWHKDTDVVRLATNSPVPAFIVGGLPARTFSAWSN